MVGEAVAVLQLEDPRPALFDRHDEDDAVAPGRLGHRGAEQLVDEDTETAITVGSDTAKPFVDQRLGRTHRGHLCGA